ncbi:MAG TPA: LamG-like jellyroll fold domain-containing protein [Verrucomicrobiae bacterium]|nr:LamG-like jellyroll fold domain-containing protein [Verrucomicrobiae bacterium]
MNDERLSHLIDAFLDGQLTPDEQAELEDLLRRSAAARAQFWQESRLHALLHAVENETAAEAPLALPSRSRMAILPWVSALAACLVLLALLGSRFWPARSHPPVKIEATTAAVAVLTRAADVKWSGAAGPQTGAALEPGWVKLESGLAQIEFFGGARVLLEGPAELQLLSPSSAFCRAGKLSAEVPPAARGFSLGTPQTQIRDLGTAFGVEVTPAGAEVHVFQGEIELNPAPAGHLQVKAGEALLVGHNLTVQPVAADRTAFASLSDLDHKLSAALHRRKLEWDATSAEINDDPSLLVRFDFARTPTALGALPNVAAHGTAVKDGAIVGCRWTEGRWPGKSALEFGRVSDRVRLEVPGELKSATLAAWVRVNGLDRAYNSLFMADGFAPGATHWQILNNGVVRLGVANRDGANHADYDSRVVFTPERFGQWVHLAVVYDATAGQVTHYVDGRVAGRAPLAFSLPLHIGPAQLGNWDTGRYAISGPIAIRHFSGCMDEFDLFQRALNDKEVEQLYAAGAPQPGPMQVAQVTDAFPPNKNP